MVWITPYSQHTAFPLPLTLESKVRIFKEKTLGWQLDIADASINGAPGFSGTPLGGPILHSGYAVIQTVLVYFELIAKMIDGYADDRESAKYFRKGLLDVYPQLGADAQAAKDVHEILYRSARCGLYHAGSTGPRVGLDGGPPLAIMYDPQNRSIVLNPHRLVPDLKQHLNEYVAKLLDPSNATLRTNFETRFDYLWSSDPLAP